MPINIDFNIKDIILVLFVIIIIYLLFFKKSNEHFETTQLTDEINTAINNKYTADIDAIRNLASISKQILNTQNELYIPASKVTTPGLINANNITSNGTISSNGDISSSSNITATGNITAIGRISSKDICIDGFCFTKLDLKKLLYSKTNEAGFATNNGFLACPLYEGDWNLSSYNNTQGRFAFGSDNTWDYVYVNKGWTIRVYADFFTVPLITCSNLTDDKPVAFHLGTGTTGLVDKVSSYSAVFTSTA